MLRHAVAALVGGALLAPAAAEAQRFGALSASGAAEAQEAFRLQRVNPRNSLWVRIDNNECPAVVSVYNPGTAAVWRATFALDRVDDWGERGASIAGTIPYLPGRARTSLSIPCRGGRLVGSSYVARGVPYSARVARDFVEGRQDWHVVDAEFGGRHYGVGPPQDGAGSAAAALLEFVGEADRGPFVAALTRTPEGVAAIARFVRERGVSARWTEAQVASLCATRDDLTRGSLWIAAVTAARPEAMEEPSLASQVLLRCVPAGPALPAVAQAHSAESGALALMLAAAPDADFPAVLEAVKQASGGGRALAAFLRVDERAARLGPAVDAAHALRPAGRMDGEVIRALSARGDVPARAAALAAFDAQRAAADAEAWRRTLTEELEAALRDPTAAESSSFEWLAAALARRGGDARGVLLGSVRADPAIFRPEAVERALGTPEALARHVLTARRDFAGCADSFSGMQACGERVVGPVAAVAELGLAPAYLDAVARALSFPVGVDDPQGEAERRRALAAMHRPWGLDAARAAAAVCRQVRQLVDAERPRDASAALDFAAAVGPGAPCIAEARRYASGHALRSGATTAGSWLLVLAPLLVAGALTRRALAAVKGQAATEGPSASAGDGSAPSQARWTAHAAGLAGGVTRALEADGSPAARAALARLAGFERGPAASLLRELTEATLASGALSSLLVKEPYGAMYLLVFPALHDDPQSIRRHAGFAEGWAAHCEAVRAALRGDGSAELLTVAVFLGPDGSQAAAYVDHRGPAGQCAPAALLTAAEDAAVRGARLADRFEFRPQAEG